MVINKTTLDSRHHCQAVVIWSFRINIYSLVRHVDGIFFSPALDPLLPDLAPFYSRTQTISYRAVGYLVPCRGPFGTGQQTKSRNLFFLLFILLTIVEFFFIKHVSDADSFPHCLV